MSKKMVNAGLVLTVIVISWAFPTAGLGTTVDFKPRNETLWTGSVKKGTGETVLDGTILVGYSAGFPQNYAYRGYAVFDIAGLPANACVSAIRLDGYCIEASVPTHDLEIRHLLDYPVGMNATTLSDNIMAGTKYNWASGAMRTTGAHSIALYGLAFSDLESAAQGSGFRWFAVGFTEMGEDAQTGIWKGWFDTEPVLHVTYTVPVQTAPVASILADSVCTGTEFCITWGAVSGATGYEVQEPGGNWSSAGAMTAKCYTKTAAGDYSFAVRAKNNCGTGPASSSVSIKVTTLPVAPADVWAANVSKCPNVDYSVYWSSVTEADSYQISEDNGNWIEAGNKTWWNFNHSSAGTHSYRVRGVNECGGGQIKTSTNYYVLSGPSDPPILSGNTTSCHGQDVTISWSPTSNAIKYQLTDSISGAVVYSNSSTFWRAPHYSGSYEYWVSVYNGCGWSDAGGPHSVYVKPKLAVPGAPISDQNPAFVNEMYTISWDSVVGATHYELRESGIVLIFSGSDYEMQITKGQAGDFTYSIRACDDCGCTNHGPELSLTVGLHTDVVEINAPKLPESYALNQNYPNPFNPETKIEFSLKRAGYVELTIYNILGENIRSLVNDYLPAGYKAVTWDGNDNSGQQAPSGIYLYRLTTGEYTATKKMIMVK